MFNVERFTETMNYEMLASWNNIVTGKQVILPSKKGADFNEMYSQV